MVFGQWWGLFLALAKDREQTKKDIALAVRLAMNCGNKDFEKFLNN